jgi:N-hydroxyarylamine O-acetyltransferase
MNKNEYLRRLGIEKNNIEPTPENLRLLQRRHLLRVPFENLDIHRKRPITLDRENFYEKIVGQKRGGFCYELNGLFYELLGEIGFESRMISARVSAGDGRFGAEYDHLAILTRVGEKEFVVDVGFGDFTAGPLEFVADIEQQDENGVFLIRKFDENYFEIVKKDHGDRWKSEYIFTARPRLLDEFAEMCLYQQTSPASHFTRGRVCSLMTEDGRKTLTDKKFIETRNGKKSEIDVETEEDFDRILEREFDISPCQ